MLPRRYESFIIISNIQNYLSDQFRKKAHGVMSSKKAFKAMEAGDWSEVKEIVATLPKEELGNRYGVKWQQQNAELIFNLIHLDA